MVVDTARPLSIEQVERFLHLLSLFVTQNELAICLLAWLEAG